MGNNVTETKQHDDFQSIEEGMSFAELFNDEQLNVANVGDVVQGTIIDSLSLTSETSLKVKYL